SKITLAAAHKRKTQSEPGSLALLIGLAMLVVGGAAIFFLVQKPKMDELDKRQAKNSKFSAELAARKAKIKDLPKLQKAVDDVSARASSIQKLVDARAVP